MHSLLQLVRQHIREYIDQHTNADVDLTKYYGTAIKSC